eukprot:4121810-Amphidinium_carterae.1
MPPGRAEVRLQSPVPPPAQRSQIPRSRSMRRSNSPIAQRGRRSESLPDARLSRRLVLQGFSKKYSLDEFKQLSNSVLRLPEHTLVLSRALFANRCTIILASHDEALRIQKSFKEDPRHDGDQRLYANWVVSALEAKKGWILRAARRALTTHKVEN